MKTISVLVVVFFGCVIAAKWPSAIKKCKLKSPDVEECLKQATQVMYSMSKNEISEFGIPSMDPLKIPSITIPASDRAVTVEQKYKNIKIYGLSDIRVDKIRFDFDNGEYFAAGFATKLIFKADYDLDGKVLLLPIRGKGSCELNLFNSSASHTFHTEKYEKNGATHLNITKWVTILDPEFAVYQFDNLFDGDKALGDNINKVLNENWKDVYVEVKAAYEEVWAAVHWDVVNRFFARFSIKDLFEE